MKTWIYAAPAGKGLMNSVAKSHWWAHLEEVFCDVCQALCVIADICQVWVVIQHWAEYIQEKLQWELIKEVHLEKNKSKRYSQQNHQVQWFSF